MLHICHRSSPDVHWSDISMHHFSHTEHMQNLTVACTTFYAFIMDVCAEMFDNELYPAWAGTKKLSLICRKI